MGQVPVSYLAVSHEVKQKNVNGLFIPSCCQNSVDQITISNLAATVDVGLQINDNDVGTAGQAVIKSQPPAYYSRLQKLLLVILHTYNCEKHESALPLHLCERMKLVLDHRQNCSAGELCQVPDCYLSGYIISHLKICKLLSCDLCSFFKILTQGWCQKKIDQVTISNLAASLDVGQEINDNDFGTAGQAVLKSQPPAYFSKIEKLQKHFIVILHAYNCKKHEDQSTLHHCKRMKLVLNHMQNCSAGELCQEPDCYLSSFITGHLKICKLLSCDLCSFCKILTKGWCKNSLDLLPPVYNLPALQDIGQKSNANDVSIAGQSFLNNELPKEFTKMERLQKLLVTILHACNCRNHKDQSTLHFCKRMKYILSHMKNCSAGEMCYERECYLSRYVIGHIKGCKQLNCDLCCFYKVLIASWSLHSISLYQIVFSNLPSSQDIKQENCANDASIAGQSVLSNQLSMEITKMERLHRLLVTILHAYECRIHKDQHTLHYCKRMKFVLSHMKNCLAGELCREPGCNSSRYIKEHLNGCTQLNCDLCCFCKYKMTRCKILLQKSKNL